MSNLAEKLNAFCAANDLIFWQLKDGDDRFFGVCERAPLAAITGGDAERAAALLPKFSISLADVVEQGLSDA